MIIKRVSDALRRQDWAMVAIEFALVVVGVLLAFQIDEYGNRRQAATAREAATARLLREAEESVAYLRQAADAHETQVADLTFALLRVQAGRWEPGDEARMTRGLARVDIALPLAPPSSVYDDLVASGIFGSIGNAELRSLVAKYRSTLAFYAEVQENLGRDDPRLEDAAALTYRFTPEGRRRTELKVDYPALAKDRLVQEKLARLADDHRAFLLLRKRAFKNAVRMCVALGAFINKRCNLNLPPPTFD